MDQLLGKTSLDPTWHFVRADSTLIPLEEYPVHRILQTQTAFQDYVLGIYQGGYLRSWVLVNGFPEFDAHHQLSQVVITFVDISGLKQAEASLFQSLRGVGVGWSGGPLKGLQYLVFKVQKREPPNRSIPTFKDRFPAQ